MNYTIGEKIRRLRREKGVTQEQLAESVGVTCAAVSRWERSEAYPDITLLGPLAYYFGVSTDELLGYNAAKTEQEIEDTLAEYTKLCVNVGETGSREYITAAFRRFPNDWRIMNAYMWNIGGNYADNDPAVLREHAEEFRELCRRTLENCTDFRLRQDALNMEAKLLWAEGRTEEALAVYRDNFASWYDTWEQKSEQLFPKNSSEFRQRVRENMLELGSFAADKIAKVIYFGEEPSLEERIGQALRYGKLLSGIAEETKDAFFGVVALNFWGRIRNDIHFRGGGEEAENEAKEAYRAANSLLAEIAVNDPQTREHVRKSTW